MKEFLLSLKDYLPYIALVITVVGMIFRNQLALIGDTVTKTVSRDRKIIATFLGYLLAFGGPTYLTAYGIRQPLSHSSVIWMITGASLLVFNLCYFFSIMIDRMQTRKHNELVNKLEALEQKFEEEKSYNKERTKVLKYYTDIVVRIERLKHSDNVDMKELEELQKELEESMKKYSHVQI